jgi:hypothetical protein
MGVLIALLLPALSGVREATRRVVCMSNIRQQGLGLMMYSQDNQGVYPSSHYLPKFPGPDPVAPQFTNIVRRDPPAGWDGLGLLYINEYVNAPQVFYCPSHHGGNPLAANLPLWYDDGGKIFMNYQYRGVAVVTDTTSLRQSILSDGLSQISDYSHNVGCNVLRLDSSVGWVQDVGGQIAQLLPADVSVPSAAAKVSDAWNKIDTLAPVGP